VNELRDNKLAYYFVGRLDGRIVGYGGIWVILEDSHVTTIAVHPDMRGKRLGEEILVHLLDEAIERDASWITLEVRESNDVAQKLYRKYGFTVRVYASRLLQRQQRKCARHVGGKLARDALCESAGGAEGRAALMCVTADALAAPVAALVRRCGAPAHVISRNDGITSLFPTMARRSMHSSIRMRRSCARSTSTPIHRPRSTSRSTA